MQTITPVVILLLVAFVVWFVYNKLKDYSFDFGGLGFGIGKSGDGSGESGKTPGSDESPVSVPVGQTNNTPTPGPVVMRRPPLPPARSTTVLDNILKHMPGVIQGIKEKQPQIASQNDLRAKRLQAANKDAKSFQWKRGTTTKINNALQELKKLPDPDFIQVVNLWKKLDKVGSIYDTNIGSAQITNDERSNFLNRVRNLNLI